MHHLATARLVAWVAWKLSEQRAAKQPHQRRSRYRTLQEHMPSLHHALLRFACMHFPLLCYKAHNTLFAHTHSQIVRLSTTANQVATTPRLRAGWTGMTRHVRSRAVVCPLTRHNRATHQRPADEVPFSGMLRSELRARTRDTKGAAERSG